MKRIPNITYFTLALIALSCLMLARALEAVEPPPDGGYPNNNTAEGEDALFSLISGNSNTAAGFEALFNNTTVVRTQQSVDRRCLATRQVSTTPRRALMRFRVTQSAWSTPPLVIMLS